MAPSKTVSQELQEALARHAEAAATVRAFAARSGAERVVLLVDAGTGADATMLDCTQSGALELTAQGRTFTIPADTRIDAAPREVRDVRSVPASAMAMDPETGELEAPLGAIAVLGTAVLGLATAFGGRSVATADFPTRDPQLPITIAARQGEPLVLAAGDRRFVLPLGDG